MDRRPVLPLSVRPAAPSRCGATENFLHQVSIAQRIVRAIVGLVAICIGLDFAADLHRYGLPARTMPICKRRRETVALGGKWRAVELCSAQMFSC